MMRPVQGAGMAGVVGGVCGVQLSERVSVLCSDGARSSGSTPRRRSTAAHCRPVEFLCVLSERTGLNENQNNCVWLRTMTDFLLYHLRC